MSYNDWKDKTASFKKIDVRGVQGNFFPGLKMQAAKMAVGAGRMRQATRELVKAYIHGLDSAALDDVFELLAWNQGIGYFSSEIGPSTLFQAYKTIKQMEKKGNSRAEIIEVLKDKFTEKNPDIKLM